MKVLITTMKTTYAPVEEDVPRSHSAKPSPRRKIAYRPLRRFDED